MGSRPGRSAAPAASPLDRPAPHAPLLLRRPRTSSVLAFLAGLFCTTAAAGQDGSCHPQARQSSLRTQLAERALERRAAAGSLRARAAPPPLCCPRACLLGAGLLFLSRLGRHGGARAAGEGMCGRGSGPPRLLIRLGRRRWCDLRGVERTRGFGWPAVRGRKSAQCRPECLWRQARRLSADRDQAAPSSSHRCPGGEGLANAWHEICTPSLRLLLPPARPKSIKDRLEGSTASSHRLRLSPRPHPLSVPPAAALTRPFLLRPAASPPGSHGSRRGPHRQQGQGHVAPRCRVLHPGQAPGAELDAGEERAGEERAGQERAGEERAQMPHQCSSCPAACLTPSSRWPPCPAGGPPQRAHADQAV